MTMITSNRQQIGAGTTDGLVVQPALDSAGNPAKVAFFGGNPAPQAAGNAQAAVVRGQSCGMVATFASTQSPSSVATLSTLTSAMTLVGGTGASVTIASGDVLFINKPSAQAGVGVGNIAVSSAGVAVVSFANLSAGFLTPTASELYGVVALRGFNKVSGVLTPASVLSASVVEQQFAMTGLRAGELVQVSKPTNQLGLDIAGCRVVSNNVLGVSFINATAGPLTPTAGETYTVICLGGIDAMNNDVLYQVSAGATATIASSTTVTAAITLSNLAVGDMVVGIQKPTGQAGLLTGSAFVSSVGKLCVTFSGQAAGGITPTANEVYGVATKRPNPVAPLLIYSQTLTPASVAANTTAEQSFAVTGVPLSTAVWVNGPAQTPNVGIMGCRVSSLNNIGITFANPTAAALTPASGVYVIGNFQMLVDNAGNSVIQSAVGVAQQTVLLANALRSALAGSSFIAGA